MPKRRKLKEIQDLTGLDGVTTPNERVEFATTFASMLRPEIPPPIVQWTEDNIDLALDKDSAFKGKLVLRPWQREVLEEYAKDTTEEVCLMSCSRAGKSILAIATTLYNLRWFSVPCAVMRETIDFSGDMWKQNIRPVAQMVDGLKDYALNPKNFRNGTFSMPKASLRLLGGGTALTGKTLCRVVGDEIDRYMDFGGELPNWMHLERRTVTWPNRKILFMSTPTTDGVNTIYGRWRESSMGKWHISCLKCGHLWDASNFGYPLPVSGKQVGLEWKKDTEGNVVPSSVKFICPACFGVHRWEDAEEMNLRGKFVHSNPTCLNRRGFQVGGLGIFYNQDKTWYNIAVKYENAGKNAPREKRQEFQNEFKGLQFKDAKVNDTEKEELLQSKVKQPDKDWKPVAVVAAADTQQSEGKKYWPTSVFGIDSQGNMHQLECKKYYDILTLEKELVREGKWRGVPLTMMLIDVRGFASNEHDVKPFIVRNRSKVIGWCGFGYNSSTLTTEGWEPQKTGGWQGVINCCDKHFQSLALDAIYIHNDLTSEGIYFMDNLPEEFFEQIKNMSQTKDWQTDFATWKPNSGRIDWFDVLKMALAAREFLGDPRLCKVANWNGRIPPFVERRVSRIIERHKTTR